MSDTRQAIARALQEFLVGEADRVTANALDMADAVLPLVAEAERRGYERGYADGRSDDGFDEVEAKVLAKARTKITARLIENPLTPGDAALNLGIETSLAALDALERGGAG